MSAQKNVALSHQILNRHAQLVPQHTVGDPSIPKILADEFGLSYQMICYYLRGGNRTSPARDSRRAYSSQELNNLDLMSPEDREAWATYTGRTLRAVDAALARHRKSFQEYITTTVYAVPMALEDITKRGYFNFASLPELKALNFDRSTVEEAKRNLKPYGLSLRAPNILFHSHTKRRIILDTQKQMYLLTDTRKFLQVYAPYIRENWQTSDTDPITDPPVEAESMERITHVTHRRTRNASLNLSLKRAGEQLTKLLPDAIKYETLQHGTPTCETLATLKIWLDRALETALPKDSYVDHVNPTQELSPKPQPSEQEDEEHQPSGQDEDDSWMADFKCVGAPEE